MPDGAAVAAGLFERHAGQHRVLAAGDPGEHAAGVFRVPGLAEELAVEDHHRVRRQHQLARMGLRRRLLVGEAEDVLRGRLAGRGVSSRSAARTVKRSPRPPAARGGGGRRRRG